MTKPNFKNTRFFVGNDVEGVKVQQAMFALGFKWQTESKAGLQRELKHYFAKGGFIYVDKDCRMTFCGYEVTFKPFCDFTPALQSALFAAAESHKVGKRVARKLSRKRSSLRRQGWVFPTDMAEVPRGVPIDMVFEDESHLENFTLNCVPWHVVRYRVCKPPTVSLKDMVAGIVKDADGVEVQEVDSDGFIRWNGGACPVPEGTYIDVRFRKEHWGKKEMLGVSCGVYGTGTSERFWLDEGKNNDIVAYRMASLKVDSLSSIGSIGTLTTTGTITGAGEFLVDSTGEVVADTNPKRQYGVASVPLNMWSPLASAYGSLALYNGALKYGKANFANTKVEASIYIAAAYRHLSAWASGQEFDPADGVPNLGGVLANIAILLEARAAGTLIDDRLRMDGYLKEIDNLKEIAKSLNALHEGKNPKHYTLEAV